MTSVFVLPNGSRVTPAFVMNGADGESFVTAPSSFTLANGTRVQAIVLVDADGNMLPGGGGGGVLSSSYDVDSTGASDSVVGLQAFLDDLSSTGQPGVLMPGTYRASEILTVGSNTTLSMYGATIECYNTDLGAGGYGNTVPVLLLDDVDHIIIRGGTINGRKASMGASEHKHGISIAGGSYITIEDITLTACKGDGAYIEPQGGTVTPEKVTMNRVVSDANYRQGLSVLALDNGRFTDCSFINTTGTNPQSGVDLEPESAASVCRDLVFTRCEFDGNAGSGFVVSFQASASTVQRDITLTDCTIRSNSQWGLWLANAVGFTATNLRVVANVLSQGVWILDGTNTDIVFDNPTITGNGDNGILISPFSAAMTVKGLKIIGGVIGGNSVRSNNSFPGISFNVGSYSLGVSDVLISGTTIGRTGVGSTQVYGIAFGASVTHNDTRITNVNYSEGNTLTRYDFTAAAVGIPASGVTELGCVLS